MVAVYYSTIYAYFFFPLDSDIRNMLCIYSTKKFKKKKEKEELWTKRFTMFF